MAQATSTRACKLCRVTHHMRSTQSGVWHAVDVRQSVVRVGVVDARWPIVHVLRLLLTAGTMGPVSGPWCRPDDAHCDANCMAGTLKPLSPPTVDELTLANPQCHPWLAL
jgi:hypothetical protein